MKALYQKLIHLVRYELFPAYNISTILKNGQDKVAVEKTKQLERSGSYGITRGASYFKGGDC